MHEAPVSGLAPRAQDHRAGPVSEEGRAQPGPWVAALHVEDAAARRRVHDLEPHEGTGGIVEPEAIRLAPDLVETDLQRPDHVGRELWMIEHVFEHVPAHPERLTGRARRHRHVLRDLS